MIVVVEGVDNSGKTTFAAWLAKELRAVYIKVERPKRAIDLVSYQAILEKAHDYSGWVVADRHVAISEPIYGPICRGKHDLRWEDISMTLDRIHAIVYCRPPAAKIMNTIADRSQMEGVVDNAERLIDAYDEWWRSVFVQDPQHFLVRYDFTIHARQHIFSALLGYAERKGYVDAPIP